MIRYALCCTECGHEFSDWFDNMAEWEGRKAQFTCPNCGATKVEKGLMAPSLGAAKSNDGADCGPGICGTSACPMASMM